MSKQELTASSSPMAVAKTMPPVAVPSSTMLALDYFSRVLRQTGRNYGDIEALLKTPRALVFPRLDPAMIEMVLNGRTLIQMALDRVASYRAKADIGALFRDLSALADVRPDSYRTSPE